MFTNCLLNGIAAFALAGVIQEWFTTGETRRANWERSQAAREREQADRERERAARPENTLATTLLRLEELASEVADSRRRLYERANGHPSD